MYETIRSKVVLAAARYLSTTELFKQHNFVLSEEWNTSVGVGDSVDFTLNPNDKPGHEEGVLSRVNLLIEHHLA